MTDRYYNMEFKSQYLKESKERNKSNDKTVDLLFRRIAPVEESLGKDLYDFSVTDIVGYYKYLSTSSIDSLVVMNNQYKLYAAYAQRMGLIKDNQNHYAEIDNKVLRGCIHQKLFEAKMISRQELLDILNSSAVENVSDKAMALAIFEGIIGKNLTDLSLLEPTDFNQQNGTVKLHSGMVLNVSPKLMEWCLESANEYEFNNSTSRRINKLYHQDDTRVIKRQSNSTVDTDKARHKMINRRLDRLIDATGCNAFTVGALKESGRLQMIKDLMKGGKSLTEALYDKEMIRRYGDIPSRKKYCMMYGLD